MGNNAKVVAMCSGGRLLHQILIDLTSHVRPGVSGEDLNRLAGHIIHQAGGRPSFKGYDGFPANLCVSINDQVVHGIPSKRLFCEGDLVSLDIGMEYHGYHTDTATTVLVIKGGCSTVNDLLQRRKSLPEINFSRAEKLMIVTSESLYKGIAAARVGTKTGDIGHVIAQHITPHKFGIIKDLVGHGIGRALHEEPSVPNVGLPGTGAVLKAGQTIAIEPMVTTGDWHITSTADGWTLRTSDGSLAAHFEHTILIQSGAAKILT